MCRAERRPSLRHSSSLRSRSSQSKTDPEIAKHRKSNACSEAGACPKGNKGCTRCTPFINAQPPEQICHLLLLNTICKAISKVKNLDSKLIPKHIPPPQFANPPRSSQRIQWVLTSSISCAYPLASRVLIRSWQKLRRVATRFSTRMLMALPTKGRAPACTCAGASITSRKRHIITRPFIRMLSYNVSCDSCLSHVLLQA